jgi:hypothetical protein
MYGTTEYDVADRYPDHAFHSQLWQASKVRE